MRKYKFRGKILENFGDNAGKVIFEKGKWIYGGITYDIDRVWIDTPYYGEILVNRETVGQYTGLKDKNGKEIYEGDIVQAVFADEEEQEMKGVVVYVEAGACYMIIANNGDEWDLGYLDKIEVIGNKWEDSGLLNDNKNTESY